MNFYTFCHFVVYGFYLEIKWNALKDQNNPGLYLMKTHLNYKYTCKINNLERKNLGMAHL